MQIGIMKNLSLIEFDSKEDVMRAFDLSKPFEVHALATYMEEVQMYLVKKNTTVLLPGANVSGWAFKQVQEGNLVFQSFTSHDLTYYAINEISYMWLPVKVVEIGKKKPNKELSNTLRKLEEE